MAVLPHQGIHSTVVNTKARLTSRLAVLILLDHHHKLATPLTLAVLNDARGFALSDHLTGQAELLWATASLTVSYRDTSLLHEERVYHGRIVHHTLRQL